MADDDDEASSASSASASACATPPRPERAHRAHQHRHHHTASTRHTRPRGLSVCSVPSAPGTPGTPSTPCALEPIPGIGDAPRTGTPPVITVTPSPDSLCAAASVVAAAAADVSSALATHRRVSSEGNDGSPNSTSTPSPTQSHNSSRSPSPSSSIVTATSPNTGTSGDVDAWVFSAATSEVRVDSALQPVAVYTLGVAHGGRQWTIARRFSHFYQLDISLRYALAGTVRLPRLPPRCFYKRGSDPLLMRERTRLLEEYMRALGALPAVVASDVWAEWLARPAPGPALHALVPGDRAAVLTLHRSMRAPRRCYLLARGPLLAAYDDTDRAPTATDTPHRVVWLGGATVRDGGRDPRTLTLTTRAHTTWTLEAPAPDAARDWAALLRKAALTFPPTPEAAAAAATTTPATTTEGGGALPTPPMSPLGMGALPPAAAVLTKGTRPGRSHGHGHGHERKHSSACSSDTDSPGPLAPLPEAMPAPAPAASASSARRLWRRSVDRPLGPSLIFGSPLGSRKDADATSSVSAIVAPTASAKEPRTLVSSPLLRVQSPPAGVLHSETASTAVAAAAPQALEHRNRSLKDLMGQPPSPAITPVGAAPASPLLLPALPDAQQQHQQQQQQQHERVAEAKRRAEPQLQAILAALAAAPPTPVHAQLARHVEALLHAPPAVLARTSLCRDTVTAIQALSQGPFAHRILYALAPLARAVVAQNIIVSDQNPGATTPTPTSTTTTSAAATAATSASSSATSSSISSISSMSMGITAADTPGSPAVVAASSCFVSPVGTPRSGSPTMDTSTSSSDAATPSAPLSALASPPHAPLSPSGTTAPSASAGTGRPHLCAVASQLAAEQTPLPPASSSGVQRPARHLAPGRTAGTAKSAQSLRLTGRRILCRICEDEYPQAVLRQHTDYCRRAAELDRPELPCDRRLHSFVHLVKRHRRHVAETPVYAPEAYVSVESVAAQAAGIRYGERDAVPRCWDLITALQSVLANLSGDDVGLLTYGRRIAAIMEEKWANLREFAKIQADASRGAPPQQHNAWGLLALARSQLVAEPTASPGCRGDLLTHSSSRVSIDDFEILKKISSGAYGKVYLARKRRTKDLYAVKIQKKSDMLRKNMVENVIAERRILSSASNPYIVRLYYAFQNERYLYLVMQYCCGGDVATLLRNLGAFELDMTRVYAAETVLSLVSLHKMAYVHRDLKPDNMLINEKGHIVLTDFGLSTIGVLDRTDKQRQLQQALSTTTPSSSSTSSYSSSSISASASTAPKPRVLGTPDYLAPEILLGTGQGGPEVDWWALGVIVYEFLTGVPPFNGETPQAIFDRILRRDIVWPDDIDAAARDFIDKLLVIDPAKRLGHNGPSEIMSHPFFNGINWDTVYQESREDIFVPHPDNAEDTSYFDDHGEMIASQHDLGSNSQSSPNSESCSPEHATSKTFDDPAGNDKKCDTPGDPPAQESPPLTPSSRKEFDDFNYTNTESLVEKTLMLATTANSSDDLTSST